MAGESNKLIIVSGVSGSGKTTYCRILPWPVLEGDSIFNYDNTTMDVEALARWLNAQKGASVVVVDGLWLGDGRYVKGLRAVTDRNIEVQVLYRPQHEVDAARLSKQNDGDYDINQPCGTHDEIVENWCDLLKKGYVDGVSVIVH